jgi:two-component system, NarL family, nitrate/nitrite response regulator NarL
VSQPSVERNGFKSPTGFSKREIEVLELASQGMTNPQIARRLGLTVHAIKFHLGSIYRKLGASNRTEAAVAYALTMSNGADAAGPPVAG